MAALQAAWRGVPVTLFDANPGLGRKLLVTGSGRCNLTNQEITPERYVCLPGRLAGRRRELADCNIFPDLNNNKI